MKIKILLISVACAATLASVVRANNIASLTTWFNTDYASAGVGDLRDNGTGTITLAGVSGTVKQAYLIWHGPTNTTDPLANANVTFNGNGIVGTNIGFSSDNCWGYLNSQAYRADVTQWVTGSGAYSVADMLKPDANINGASLLVSFDDGNATNNKDIVLFDGNDSNINNPYDADGWNVLLSGINYSGGSAAFELGVSDGQGFLDDALILNGSTLVPAGQIFPGAIHGGNGPDNYGSLWDINTYDVTPYLSMGYNQLNLTTGAFEDCLSLVHAAIELPAGAAPPVPEPATLSLLGLGLAALVAARRRRK